MLIKYGFIGLVVLNSKLPGYPEICIVFWVATHNQWFGTGHGIYWETSMRSGAKITFLANCVDRIMNLEISVCGVRNGR